MKEGNKIIIALLLVTLGVTARLLPHAWNFAPIAAIAVFSGLYLGKKYAVVLPIAAMIFSDVIIGFASWHLTAVIYGSFLVMGLVADQLKKYRSLESVIAAGLIGSFIFFFATNWAVWQFSPWYEKSFSGLIECYTMALPFFRNTLLSDLFYLGIFAGTAEIAMAMRRKYVAA